MTDVSSDHAETLPDLVRRRLAELGRHGKPLSMREAARRSGNPGLYETIRKIADGKHLGRLTTETAEYLARGLEVPVAQVMRAAGMPQAGVEPFTLPARFARLTAQQRQVLISVGDAILRAAEDAAEEARERYQRIARREVASRPAGELVEQARRREQLSVRDAAQDARVPVDRWREIVAGKEAADPDTWLDMAVATRARVDMVFRALGVPLPVGHDDSESVQITSG